MKDRFTESFFFIPQSGCEHYCLLDYLSEQPTLRGPFPFEMFSRHIPKTMQIFWILQPNFGWKPNSFADSDLESKQCIIFLQLLPLEIHYLPFCFIHR